MVGENSCARDENGYFSLSAIVRAFGGALVTVGCVCGENARIRDITPDSRTVKKEDLFVALKGERADGEQYISEAFDRGATAVVCRRGVSKRIGARGIYIEVDDPCSAIKTAARAVREDSYFFVIGITGSVGKTTVKELCIKALSQKHLTDGTRGNYNNALGVSLTVLNAFGVDKMRGVCGKSPRKHRKYLVLEMGISHNGDMDELVAISAPDIAVITNIGSMHAEYLGGRDGIAKEKAKISSSGTKLVVCGDDPILLREILRYKRREDIRVLSYGKNGDGSSSDVNISEPDENGIFSVTWSTDNAEIGRFTAPIVGAHGIWDSAIAAFLGCELAVGAEQIQSGFNCYTAVPMRQEIRRIGDTVRIVDCYNSGPESVRASLFALDVYAEKYGAVRRVAVLGDMLELGEISKTEHFDLGTELLGHRIELLFTVGNEAREIARGAVNGGISRSCVFSFGSDDDSETVKNKIESMLRPGDIILYKASRGIGLERLIE